MYFLYFLFHFVIQVEKYALLDGNLLASLGGGWPEFKHAFVRMMVETGKDFTLRSVAQVSGVGPLPRIEALSVGGSDGALASDGASSTSGLAAASTSLSSNGGMDLSLGPPPLLRRHSSSSSIDEARRVSAGSPAPLRLLEMASRFENMRSWEDTDHPIVLFKMSPYGESNVDGVDLMSLNPALANEYISSSLQSELELQKINFAKDWNQVKS